jgi:shikimate kinase/3-dehydroquinate synthase
MAPLSHGAPRSGIRNQPAIALVGFMGAGKSRGGAGIASVIGERWSDSDAEVEREIGEPLAEFFEREGETRFREVEERVALGLLEGGGVVSLGGGAVESPKVRAKLAQCLTCWCRIDVETAWERSSRDERRPLARDRDAFERRFHERTDLYAEVGRVLLDSGGERTGRLAGPWLRELSGHEDARLVWASSRSGSYPAIVGHGVWGASRTALARHGRNGDSADGISRLFLVADAEAYSHHRSSLSGIGSDQVVEVPGGEASKTLTEAERVLRELARLGARRDDGVVAFGGGVVGDLAGFCAATYQRGVPVIQVPTTLVGQVDSAYGGKTGVDLPEAKNYAGAYHMPTAVLTDPGYLATLPQPELAAGFAEVVKTALLAGGALWEKVRSFDRLDPGQVSEVIFDCAATKVDVVASDERDGGARQQLNLGHTIGHGIEAAAGYGRYRHGEAVGLGMLAALRLSGAGELRDEVAALLARAGLPTALAADVETEAVIEALSRDKKRTAAGIGFVLLEDPGVPLIGQAVDEAMVRQAVDELR